MHHNHLLIALLTILFISLICLLLVFLSFWLLLLPSYGNDDPLIVVASAAITLFVNSDINLL
jgi:hypothetical protein